MTKLNDEIDLNELAKKIARFIKKHLLLLIIFFALGIFGGVYKYFATKPYFQAQMVISSSLEYEKSTDFYSTDLQPIVAILEFLSNKINKHNNDFIKNQLLIETPEIIKSIEVTILRNDNLPNADPQNITINVEVYDITILSKLQDAIVNYCNQNPYVFLRFKEQNEYKKQALLIINNRISELDSLNNKLLSSNELIFADFNSLISVVYLEMEKYKLSNIATYQSPVIIVQGFSDYPEIQSKRAINSVIVVLLFIILSFVTIFIIEIIKFFKNA
ncbi:MAG: hypothetical protein JXR68_01660 [Bacteroidales bacterium]|nr:hypothetical protein [Bacteroidales bacterium]